MGDETNRAEDFTLVEDGHDGQTEDQKREAYAAETGTRRDPGPKGDPGSSEGKSSEAGSKPSGNEDDDGRVQAAHRSGETAGYRRAVDEMNARIARSGMRNPANGEIIGDIDGLESFAGQVRKQRIAERAKREGRTEAEVEEEEANKEFVSASRREAEARKKADDETARQQAWIAADLKEFRKKYPDADIAKIDGNAEFRRFCGSRYGREPLAELYGDYLEITGGAARAAAARTESKDSRSTSGSRTGGGVTLTSDQRAELEDWNRRYPKLKMTEQEFASRK